ASLSRGLMMILSAAWFSCNWAASFICASALPPSCQPSKPQVAAQMVVALAAWVDEALASASGPPEVPPNSPPPVHDRGGDLQSGDFCHHFSAAIALLCEPVRISARPQIGFELDRGLLAGLQVLHRDGTVRIFALEMLGGLDGHRLFVTI